MQGVWGSSAPGERDVFSFADTGTIAFHMGVSRLFCIRSVGVGIRVLPPLFCMFHRRFSHGENSQNSLKIKAWSCNASNANPTGGKPTLAHLSGLILGYRDIQKIASRRCPSFPKHERANKNLQKCLQCFGRESLAIFGNL